jgi:predicted transcriptional regulator
MFDINQGPGEGNYDRIEQLCTEAAIQAAEAVQRAEKPTIEFLSFDEQDTMVMQEVNEDEGGK